MSRVLVLIVVAACSKSDGPAPSPLVGKTRALADKLCACRDAACAAPIDAEWNAIAKDQPSRQLSADDVEALANETQRYAGCLAKLRP